MYNALITWNDGSLTVGGGEVVRSIISNPSMVTAHMDISAVVAFYSGKPGFVSFSAKSVAGGGRSTITFDTEENARAANVDLIDDFPPGLFLNLAATKALMAANGITRTVTYSPA